MRPIIDQLAHFLTAIVVLIPFAIDHNFLTGAWAGLCMGMIREITEEGDVSLSSLHNVFRSPPSRMDIMFWTFGGFFVGVVS